MKLDGNNTWITSDLHFGHVKDFLWRPRGFNSIEEHDAEIIKIWNETIPSDGEVYILGDLVMGDQDVGIEKLSQLNGHLHVAIGNHDTDAKVEKYMKLANVEDVAYGFRKQCHKMSLYLTHYPTIVSNFHEKGTHCLCGHSHTTDRWLHADFGCYHVELDAHANTPILLEDIITDIKEYKKNREA